MNLLNTETRLLRRSNTADRLNIGEIEVLVFPSVGERLLVVLPVRSHPFDRQRQRAYPLVFRVRSESISSLVGFRVADCHLLVENRHGSREVLLGSRVVDSVTSA